MKRRKSIYKNGSFDIILGKAISSEFNSKIPDYLSNSDYRNITPFSGKGIASYEGDSHLMTIAPTGSGKGRSSIIPNLLNYKGPVIVLDPKGENYQVTARRRSKMGQSVYLLDPFDITGDESHSLNPFDILTLKKSNVESDSLALVELIAGTKSYPSDPFWDLSATGLISGIIIYIAKILSNSDKNISKLVEILMNSDSDMIIAKILDTHGQAIGNMACNELSSYLSLPYDRTRPSVLGSANSYLKALHGEQVDKALSSSSFPLSDITEGKKISLYIVVPPDKLRSHKSLIKLWIGTLFKAISSREKRPKHSTLFIIDECSQLEYFSYLETALTLLRGYGLQTWTFWQDLSQLKVHYKEGWSTMVNNCAVLQLFGANNYRVAKEFANLTGLESKMVSNLKKSEQLLMINGQNVFKSNRLDYLKNTEFHNKFLTNNFYKNL